MHVVYCLIDGVKPLFNLTSSNCSLSASSVGHPRQTVSFFPEPFKWAWKYTSATVGGKGMTVVNLHERHFKARSYSSMKFWRI